MLMRWPMIDLRADPSIHAETLLRRLACDYWEAGRELDAEVAKAMGWTNVTAMVFKWVGTPPGLKYDGLRIVPSFTTTCSNSISSGVSTDAATLSIHSDRN